VPVPGPRFTVSMQSSSLARRARATGPAWTGGPSGWALKPESGTMNLNLSPSSESDGPPGRRLRRSDWPGQLERSARLFNRRRPGDSEQWSGSPAPRLTLRLPVSQSWQSRLPLQSESDSDSGTRDWVPAYPGRHDRAVATDYKKKLPPTWTPLAAWRPSIISRAALGWQLELELCHCGPLQAPAGPLACRRRRRSAEWSRPSRPRRGRPTTRLRFGGSLLRNNMDVEASMELARHLDDTGLQHVYTVCTCHPI